MSYLRQITEVLRRLCCVVFFPIINVSLRFRRDIWVDKKKKNLPISLFIFPNKSYDVFQRNNLIAHINVHINKKGGGVEYIRCLLK